MPARARLHSILAQEGIRERKREGREMESIPGGTFPKDSALHAFAKGPRAVECGGVGGGVGR